jgi:hypothetical protein
MFMPQRRWLVNPQGEMLVEFIGRFENLQQDFTTVCERLSLRAELGHAKPSGRGSYRDYYDSASRDLIARCFEEDLQAFDYSF